MLAHPQEVEQAHVMLSVVAVHAHIQSRGQLTAEIVGARIGAAEVVVIIGNGVGVARTVDGVGNGHGIVAVVDVLQRTRVGIQRHTLLILIGGIRPNKVGELEGGGVLVGGEAGDHADVDGAGGNQGIQANRGGMLVTARDRAEIHDHLAPAVARGSGPMEALVMVGAIIQHEEFAAAAGGQAIENGHVVVVLPCHTGGGEVEVGIGGGAVDPEIAVIDNAALNAVLARELTDGSLVSAVHHVVGYGGLEILKGCGVSVGGGAGLEQSDRAEIHPLTRRARDQRIEAQGGQRRLGVGAHDGGHVYHHAVPLTRGILPGPGGMGSAPAGSVCSRRVHLSLGSGYVGTVDQNGVLHVDGAGGRGRQLHVGIAARSGEAGELIGHVPGSHLVLHLELHRGREVGLVGGIGCGKAPIARGEGGGILGGGEACHTAEVDGLTRHRQRIQAEGGVGYAVHGDGVEIHGLGRPGARGVPPGPAYAGAAAHAGSIAASDVDLALRRAVRTVHQHHVAHILGVAHGGGKPDIGVSRGRGHTDILISHVGVGHIITVAESGIGIRKIRVVGGSIGGKALQALGEGGSLGLVGEAGDGGNVDGSRLNQGIDTEIHEGVGARVGRDGGQIDDLSRPLTRGIAVAPAHAGQSRAHVHHGAGGVFVLNVEFAARARGLGAVMDDCVIHGGRLGSGLGQGHEGIAARSGKAGKLTLHHAVVQLVDRGQSHAVCKVQRVAVIQHIPVILVCLIGDSLLVGGEADDGLDVHVLSRGGQIQHIHAEGGILVAARGVGHIKDHGIPLARGLVGALDHGIRLLGNAHAAIGGVEAELGLRSRHGGVVHHDQILHLVAGAGG